MVGGTIAGCPNILREVSNASGPQIALPICFEFTRIPPPADHELRDEVIRLAIPDEAFVRGVEVGLEAAPAPATTPAEQLVDQVLDFLGAPAPPELRRLVVRVEWSRPVPTERRTSGPD